MITGHKEDCRQRDERQPVPVIMNITYGKDYADHRACRYRRPEKRSEPVNHSIRYFYALHDQKTYRKNHKYNQVADNSFIRILAAGKMP